MMARLLGAGSLMAGLCLASLAHADELPAPVDAKVVDQRPVLEQERIYPLGGLRKISGKLRMEGQLAARGQVSSVTYELPPEQTANEAFTVAREALQAQGAHTLYWCQARDCGESSLWANDVFGNAKLYGSDEQQAFVLLRRAAPNDNSLVAVYSITRGNRRAYLHVEDFVASEPLGEQLPTPSTVLRELRSTGELDYPALTGEPPASWVELLARSLNLDSTLRVTVSGADAGAWRDALIAQGVRAARLETSEKTAKGVHVELIR